MANALDRDIQEGEVVVLSAEEFEDGTTTIERAVICREGAGMLRTAASSRIHGDWWDGAGAVSFFASAIDPEETAVFLASLLEEAIG